MSLTKEYRMRFPLKSRWVVVTSTGNVDPSFLR